MTQPQEFTARRSARRTLLSGMALILGGLVIVVSYAIVSDNVTALGINLLLLIGALAIVIFLRIPGETSRVKGLQIAGRDDNVAALDPIAEAWIIKTQSFGIAELMSLEDKLASTKRTLWDTFLTTRQERRASAALEEVISARGYTSLIESAVSPLRQKLAAEVAKFAREDDKHGPASPYAALVGASLRIESAIAAVIVRKYLSLADFEVLYSPLEPLLPFSDSAGRSNLT